MSTDKITNHFKMLRAVVDDAETAALAAASEHLHQLDSLRLEASTLSRENADLALEVMQLRGPQLDWKAAYDTLAADAVAQIADLRKGFAAAAEIAHDNEAELAHVRAELSAQMAVIEKATTEAAAAAAWHADQNAAHIGRLNNFVAAVDRAMGGDGCRAPEAVLSTAATLRLLAIEHQQNCSAARAVYANVDTSLRDPRPGKLLVVRLDAETADDICDGLRAHTIWRSDFVGFLEAAQDEGDTETQPYTGAEIVIAGHVVPPVDVHHTGMPTPVVRCGECTAHKGHFGDCAKAVQS